MSFLAPTIDVMTRTKLRAWLGGVAVAVLGVGVWGFQTQVVGAHVTACHFDARGAYAEVRVNNLLGGADTQHVYVEFYVGGSEQPYEGGLAILTVPAHGRGTAVVRERFPPRDSKVQGRTVYVTGRRTGDVNDAKFRTEKFASNHPRTSVETMPDDPNSLRCSYGGDGW